MYQFHKHSTIANLRRLISLVDFLRLRNAWSVSVVSVIVAGEGGGGGDEDGSGGEGTDDSDDGNEGGGGDVSGGEQ